MRCLGAIPVVAAFKMGAEANSPAKCDINTYTPGDYRVKVKAGARKLNDEPQEKVRACLFPFGVGV
jgi:hypothetical protein